MAKHARRISGMKKSPYKSFLARNEEFKRQVREMCESMPQAEVGRKLGISRQRVYQIVNGQAKHQAA